MRNRLNGARRLAALAVAALVTLAACDGGADDRVEHRETLYVFGTLVEFVIRDVPEARARAAVAAVERDFRLMHRDWHAWKPGELARLNTAIARGETFEASPHLLPLVRRSQELAARSDDLFNPAIGRLIALWGFHADEPPRGPPPSAEEVAQLAAARPRMSDLVIDGAAVRSRNPAVQLDFGAVAKGAALDRAVARLRAMGIDNAVVNAGGDLNTMGDAGERPWRVGIRHPRHWGVIASLEVAGGEAVYTSGNYERYREHEGVRYAHIIDPRDGMPVHHIVSATVVAEEGTLADAAATALTVAGPDDWHRVARRMGVRYALLVDEDGVVYANPAMAERLSFAEGEPARLVISDPL